MANDPLAMFSRVAASDIYLLFQQLLIKFIVGAFNNTFGFVISLFF